MGSWGEGVTTTRVRHVIQISVANAASAMGDLDEQTVALCNDGTMWRLTWGEHNWEQLPRIPGTEKPSALSGLGVRHD